MEHLKEIKAKTNFQPGMPRSRAKEEPNKFKESALKTVLHFHFVEQT